MKKIILFFLLIVPSVVYADLGPKPSIDITVVNLQTSNYLIDLFVYDENKSGYNSPKECSDDNLNDEDITRLYELNFDNWISESTRWSKYLLFPDCKGNIEYKHSFSYFGTPEKYKVVIINKENDEIKITDEIIRKDFNSSITIDYDDMKITNAKTSYDILNGVVILLITIIIELLIAYIFKINKYKVIALTNFVSNSLLQVIFAFIGVFNLWLFLLLELLVLLFELIVYLKMISIKPKTKIIIYTIVANFITCALTFLMK